jgi:hypothetical protein
LHWQGRKEPARSDLAWIPPDLPGKLNSKSSPQHASAALILLPRYSSCPWKLVHQLIKWVQKRCWAAAPKPTDRSSRLFRFNFNTPQHRAASSLRPFRNQASKHQALEFRGRGSKLGRQQHGFGLSLATVPTPNPPSQPPSGGGPPDPDGLDSTAP